MSGQSVDTQFTPIDRVLEATAEVLVMLSGLTESVDRLSLAVEALHEAATGGHE